MRVLLVLHAPRDPRSAVFGWALERAELLQEHGHEATIWTPQDFPALAGRGPRWFPLTYPWAVARRLLAEADRFDLVLFHSFSGWLALLARPHQPRLAPLTLVTQFHGLEPLYLEATAREAERLGRPFSLPFRLFQGPVMDALLALAGRRSDRVLCLNRTEERFLVERGWAPAERVIRVPNSVPDAFFDAPPLPAEPRLAFLGQWLPAKGTHHLAAAFAEVTAAHPEATLACLGTRASSAAVRADFPPALADRIEVLSEGSREEMAAALGRCRVFVFPTLSEGWSLALTEAMAAGRAIVATAVGGAPDLLRDGESALLVPPADARALAAAIDRLLVEPELAARCAAGARAVAERYRWRQLAAPCLALFESLASLRQSGSTAPP